MNLNEKIKKLRKEHHMTQTQLARKLFVTRQTVSKWEQGLSEPSLDILSKLSDIFGVSTDELIGIAEKNREIDTECRSIERESDIKNENKSFWTVYKEIALTLIIGIITITVYLTTQNYGWSITLYVAVELPFLAIALIITAVTDKSVKTKAGFFTLVIPPVVVILFQIVIGIIIEL